MGSKETFVEAQPPPYSFHAVDNATSSQGASITQLQHQLSFLPARISRTREAHTIQQSLDDSSLLDLIVPQIEDFLSNLSNAYPTPKLAYLKVVPAAPIPRGASLSGIDEMRKRGELCQLARVSIIGNSDEKKAPSDLDFSAGSNRWQDWSTGEEFDDWGRFGDSFSVGSTKPQDTLWWKDEDMARRLASHLQPATVANEPAIQTPVQAVVEHRLPAQKEKRRWSWARKSEPSFATKTVETEVESFPRQNSATPTRAQSAAQRGAKMSITAEEVAFRVENHFGLMESVCGWAIVVTVRVTT